MNDIVVYQQQVQPLNPTDYHHLLSGFRPCTEQSSGATSIVPSNTKARRWCCGCSFCRKNLGNPSDCTQKWSKKVSNRLVIKRKDEKKSNLPPVSRVTDSSAVIEEDAHGAIRQLETESVLVRVVDPL